MRPVQLKLIAGEIDDGCTRYNYHCAYGLLKQTFYLCEGHEELLCTEAQSMLSNLRQALQPEIV